MIIVWAIGGVAWMERSLRSAIQVPPGRNDDQGLHAPSQFPFERFVENGRQQGVEFGGGFGLQAFQGVYLRLEGVEFGYDTALFGERGLEYPKSP